LTGRRQISGTLGVEIGREAGTGESCRLSYRADIERIDGGARDPNGRDSPWCEAFVAVINIITKAAAQVPGEYVSMQTGEQDMRG